MSQVISCPACGWRNFHGHYHPAQEAWRFLWIKRPAQPAKVAISCLRCGWEGSYDPGSIRAATDVMRSLEFDIVA